MRDRLIDQFLKAAMYVCFGLVAVFLIGVIVIYCNMFLSAYDLYHSEKSVPQQQYTQTDFVMFCQKLSAETSNSAWKYDNCLNQLMESAKGKGVRML